MQALRTVAAAAARPGHLRQPDDRVRDVDRRLRDLGVPLCRRVERDRPDQDLLERPRLADARPQRAGHGDARRDDRRDRAWRSSRSRCSAAASAAPRSRTSPAWTSEDAVMDEIAIRSAVAEDGPALYEICRLTGDAGEDAERGGTPTRICWARSGSGPTWCSSRISPSSRSTAPASPATSSAPPTRRRSRRRVSSGGGRTSGSAIRSRRRPGTSPRTRSCTSGSTIHRRHRTTCSLTIPAHLHIDLLPRVAGSGCRPPVGRHPSRRPPPPWRGRCPPRCGCRQRQGDRLLRARRLRADRPGPRRVRRLALRLAAVDVRPAGRAGRRPAG